MTKNC